MIISGFNLIPLHGIGSYFRWSKRLPVSRVIFEEKTVNLNMAEAETQIYLLHHVLGTFPHLLLHLLLRAPLSPFLLSFLPPSLLLCLQRD